MKSALLNSFIIVPFVASVITWLDGVCGYPIPGRDSGVALALAAQMGRFACWVFTVVMACGLMKEGSRLILPLGVLLVVAGLVAFLQGSVAGFGAVLILTLAASLCAIQSATRGPRQYRAFSAGFAASSLLGISFTLLARFPITYTPILQYMWWTLTERGSPWSFIGSAHLGSYYLFLTWFVAYTVGWLMHLYVKIFEVWIRSQVPR
jgi:hypothetical protein